LVDRHGKSLLCCQNSAFTIFLLSVGGEIWRLLIGNALLYSSLISQQGGFNKKLNWIFLMKKWFLVQAVLVGLLPGWASAAENSVSLETVIAELHGVRARRIHAIWECHRRGPAAVEALPTLIRVLRHEDQQDTALVLSAIAAVGAGDSRAVQALLNEISRENQVYRRVAVESLVRLGRDDPGALDAIIAHFLRDARAAEILVACGPAAGRELLARVDESEGELRDRYLALFSALAEEPEAPVIVLDLARHLRGKDVAMSLSAMEALQRFGKLGEGALPELTALLRSTQDPILVNAACTTLGTIGASGLPALVRTLDSDLEATRIAVVTILEMLGPVARPAAPSLQKMLRQEESGLMRYRLRAALQAMGY
jgi:hypothetical protein